MSLDFSTTNLAPVNRPNFLVVTNAMYATNRTGSVVVGRAVRSALAVRATFTALFTLVRPMAFVARLESSSPDADPVLLSRANQVSSPDSRWR